MVAIGKIAQFFFSFNLMPVDFMRRSNRNFNITPQANPGHLTIFCSWGVGNLMLKFRVDRRIGLQQLYILLTHEAGF